MDIVSQFHPTSISDVPQVPFSDLLLEWGTFIWVFGVFILLLYTIYSYLKIQHIVSTAIRKEGNVYESDRIPFAFVMGIIKPRIYIPLNLSNDELTCIMLHEQMHLNRLDHLVKLFAYLVKIAHWFNPFIWISCKLLENDMEMSCDESVLKHLNPNMRICYSKALLFFSQKKQANIFEFPGIFF